MAGHPRHWTSPPKARCLPWLHSPARPGGGRLAIWSWADGRYSQLHGESSPRDLTFQGPTVCFRRLITGMLVSWCLMMVNGKWGITTNKKRGYWHGSILLWDKGNVRMLDHQRVVNMESAIAGWVDETNSLFRVEKTCGFANDPTISGFTCWFHGKWWPQLGPGPNLANPRSQPPSFTHKFGKQNAWNFPGSGDQEPWRCDWRLNDLVAHTWHNWHCS